MDYHKHFARDSKICGGQTVIAGTRVPLRTILASVAEGLSPEEIVRQFPSVTLEDVRAAIAFAAASAQEDLPLPAVPRVGDAA